ncbi:MAG: 30S ribosomal protein S20 [Bacteroidota bacterium]|nr:30S ribosomal protein S20 [Bacteroidota bacterium]
MAHHKSAIKRIRQIETRRLRNRYQAKTTRNMVRKLRATKDVAEAQKLYIDVISALDKLAKRGLIHKNNASNKKSRLAKFVNQLSK